MLAMVIRVGCGVLVLVYLFVYLKVGVPRFADRVLQSGGVGKPRHPGSAGALKGEILVRETKANWRLDRS
jgi:hypothetical protein